jgi:hypothetical protein
MDNCTVLLWLHYSGVLGIKSQCISKNTGHITEVFLDIFYLWLMFAQSVTWSMVLIITEM